MVSSGFAPPRYCGNTLMNALKKKVALKKTQLFFTGTWARYVLSNLKGNSGSQNLRLNR